MRFISLLLLLSLVSCSSVTKEKIAPPESSASSEMEITYTPQKITVNAGEVNLVTLADSPLFDEQGDLLCRNVKIPFYKTDKGLHFYLAESYFSKKKPFECLWVEPGKEGTVVLNVTIGSKKYPSETLHVDKKRVVLSPKDLKRAIAEKEELDAVYSTPTEAPFFTTPFNYPIKSKITSVYGSQRVYNDHKTGQHLGVDFRAKIGTPIKVSNRGKVVLVKNLFFTGGTIVVDHGLGIFTVYAHMSKFLVSVGDMLERGDVVGLSGMTGRVTGPHLHWGVKIQDSWINGLSLINTSLQLTTF